MRKNRIFAFILSIITAVGIIIPVNIVPVTAEEAMFENFRYLNDFSSYDAPGTQSTGSWDMEGIGRWVTVKTKETDDVDQWSQDMTVADPDGNSSGVLRLGDGARPAFFFDTPITSGNVHVGFDVLFDTKNAGSRSNYPYSYYGFMNKWNGEYDEETDTVLVSTNDGTTAFDNPLVKAFMFFANEGCASPQYGLGGLGDANIKYNTLELNKWMRVDVIYESIGVKDDMVVKYYVDGKLAHTMSDPSLKKVLQPFYGFVLQTSGNFNNEYALVDNIVIEQSCETKKLELVGESDCFDYGKNSVRFNLTDNVDTKLLTPENIIVTKDYGTKTFIPGEYRVDNKTSNSFDLVFEDGMERGIYTVKFTDNVVSSWGMPAEGAFKFTVGKLENFVYRQDFSESDGPSGAGAWDDASIGQWVTAVTSATNDVDQWERKDTIGADGKPGVLSLGDNARPAFWFNMPVADGSIHLSYYAKFKEQTKTYPYYYSGFAGAGYTGDITISDDKVNVSSHSDSKLVDTFMAWDMHTSSPYIEAGIFDSNQPNSGEKISCDLTKWYKFDVLINIKSDGNIEAEYYVDGVKKTTRTSSSVQAPFYGMIFQTNSNFDDGEVLIDDVMISHYGDVVKEFKYTQDFSENTDKWDKDDIGKWMSSYKKGDTVLDSWSRYEDATGNGMLKLYPGSRPVFWFNDPVRKGNVRLSYDICYTKSSGEWSYFWGGFQSAAATKTSNGIEIDGNMDNTGLLNGFGIQTNSNEMLYGMTTAGGGMSVGVCEPGKWYKLEVTHENLDGQLVSKYYIDGNLIFTRTDQNFDGTLYGVTFYLTGNNKENEILIDNLVVESFAQTEKEAKAVLSDVTDKTNIDSVTLGTKTSPGAVTYGDKACWLMNSTNPDINIIFSETFKPQKFDGSLYTVEVDYYDVAEGYFRLYYDSLENNKKVADTVYTDGSATWKTATFTLNDADFGKLLDSKYDLRISLNALTSEGISASSGNVTVKEIRVKREMAKNPVFVTSATSEPGHTFAWFSDNKIIINTITNFSDEKQDISVTYKLKNDSGKVVFSETEELTLDAGTKKTTEVDFGEITRCDIYDWIVEIKNNSGKETVFAPLKTAIIKTDPNGIKNDNLYFAVHGEEFSIQNVGNAVEMLELANVGGVRTSVYWDYLETAKGVYDWNQHKSKPFLDELKASGIEVLPIMHGGSAYWNLGTCDMPYTADEMEGWKGYISYMAPILSEVYDVKRYEIWNEPDIEYFNPRYYDDVSNNGGTGKDYANLFKATKEIIKSTDAEAKVGGPGMANTNYGWLLDQNNGYKYFTEMLNGGFADYADAVSIHPYGYLGDPVDTNEKMTRGIKQYKERLQSKNSSRSYEVWLSETGYTTADAKIQNAYNQGALNCRTAIYAKANGLSDLTVFYNLEKKGTIETNREDMFGHVSCGKSGGEKYGTYFVPEKSYLMVAAMNYVMAETTQKSIYDSSDGTVKISRFESGKFGKDVLAFYSTDESKGITLNLGVDEITYIDYLGNESIQTSKDGIYAFAAESAPQYIVGDFTKIEYSENSDAFVIKDIDTTVYGKVTLTVTAKTASETPKMLIVETMSEGRVKEIVFVKEVLAGGESTYTLNISDNDFDTVLAFIWDSESGIKPLCRGLSEKTGGKQ